MFVTASSSGGNDFSHLLKCVAKIMKNLNVNIKYIWEYIRVFTT